MERVVSGSGGAIPHVTVPTGDAMEALGAALGAIARAGDVIVLTGPLGAGKTTLTRGLGGALGVRGPVASPTFVLARTHPSLVGGPALIHVDAYRLRDALEFDDLDLDLDTSVTVVEWGREVVPAVTDTWLELELERPRAGAGSDADDLDAPRRVTLVAHGARWHDDPRLAALATAADA